MPDTLPNVKLPKGGVWIDVYAVLGIAIGTPLTIQSLSASSAKVSIQETSPESDDGHQLILKGQSLTAGKDGNKIWASSQSGGAINVSLFPTIAMLLHDGFGNPIASLRESLDFHDSDVHRTVFNQFLHFDTATTTTLADPVAAGANQINLVSAVGFTINNEIKVSNGAQEPVFFTIKTLAGTLATLDTPITLDHLAGAEVTKIHTNLAEVGITAGATLASPVIFTSHTVPNQVVHITGMSIIITDTSAMDFTTFGGAAALINGLVFRAKSDGFTGSFTNWKANLDLDSDAFPVRYQEKVGGGEFGLSAIYQIKESTGAIIYLDGSKDDKFEALAQDSLELNTKIRIKLQGHFEGL